MKTWTKMKATEKKADPRCSLAIYFTEYSEDLNVSLDRESKESRMTPWLENLFRM